MGKTFLKETTRLLQAKRQRKRWKRTVISLSLVVAMVTSSLLSHPAITMERTASCGISEHTHDQSCYQRQLICQQEEINSVPATEEKLLSCQLTVHEHTDECKDENGELICGIEAHTHEDGCYQIITTPAVEGHTHSDACYEDVLICQQTVHVHSDSCFETEAAPAETTPETAAPATEAEKTETEAAETEKKENKKNDKKKETDKQTDSEETSAEETWEAQVLTVTEKEYTITVEAAAEAKIPQGAGLKVRELKEETDLQEYTTYAQQAAAKVQQQLAKEILYGQYFDLTIEAEGKEIQPAVPVKVKITYTKAIENPEGSEIKAIAFGDTLEILNPLRTNLNNSVWSEAEFEVKTMNVLVLGGIGTAQTMTEAPKTEAVTESEAEAATEAETEAATELHTEGETVVPSTETELEPSEVETEEITEAVSEAEIESETETEPATEAVTETFTETEIEEMTEADTEEASEIESESESEVVTEEATEQEAESEVMTEEMTELESETETVAANTLTAENTEYRVTVSYDENANLPENVTLSLTNYEENDTEYQEALEAVISAKQSEEDFEADQLQLRALDISILDEDGNELEPDSTVSVKIEMKNLPENCDPANVEVHHIVEEQAVAAYAMERSTARTVSLYADPVANGMALENGKAVAEFTTESFSTFTITWQRNSFITITKSLTVTCKDENGNELSVAPTNITVSVDQSFELTSSNEQLSISTYDFVSAKIIKGSDIYDNVTEIKLVYSWGSDWTATIKYGESSTTQSITGDDIDSMSVELTYRKKTDATVTFDKNGGSVAAPESQSGRIGTTITLPTYTGTKEGYIFQGWSASSGSISAEHEAGTEYTIPEDDITLYAVWKKGVTLRFDENGGSVAVDSITVSEGETVDLPAYTGTRSGYTFIGWTTAASQNAYDASAPGYSYHPVYKSGVGYTLSDTDITLYAAWSSNSAESAEFYIRLDGTIPSEPGSYGSSYYTEKIVPEGSDDNIKEKRWVVDNDTTKPISNAGAGNYVVNDVTNNLYKMPSNAELATAINSKKATTGLEVEVKENELVVKSVTYNSKSLYADRFSVGDSLYVLWYVQKLQNLNTTTGTGIWHIDGSLLAKSKISVSYDGNPPVGAGTVQKVPLGYQEVKSTEITVGASGSKNATQLTPELAGYTFQGWALNREGTGTIYKNNDKYVLENPTTFYAQWSKGTNYLTVKKTDMSGTTLKGAKFTLEEKTDGSNTWTTVLSRETNAEGIFTYDNVSSQTIYRMTEIYAPNGYETRNSFCFKVTTNANNDILYLYVVDENGNILSDNDKPDWVEVLYTPTSDNSGGSARLNITIQDEQIKRNVIFKKTAMDGTALSGASFTLTKAGTAVNDVLLEKSGTDGVFSVSGATLTYGEYVLTETQAPDGYQKAEPITITLNDPTGTASTTDGTYTTNTGMTFSGDGAANASVSMVRSTATEDNVVTTTYTYTITVKDKPTADITIKKADSNTKAALTGATFKLTTSVNGVDQAVSGIAGVGDDGSFTITEIKGYQLKGLVVGTYKLTEITAPSGYIISKDPIQFTIKVNLDGTISVTGLESNKFANVNSDGKIITVLNEAGVALPNTGGSGTSHYTLSGLMLIAAALMYGFVLRRRRERRVCG